MNPPASIENLYLAHRIEPLTSARLTEWDARVTHARRAPSTRWQLRTRMFLRAATTSASTRIEGNQLSIWSADQLLSGMRAGGSQRDQREVERYAEALDLAAVLASREPFEWHEMVLQQLNASVLRGLENDTQGRFRTGPVTVGGGFYLAPNAASVPLLMAGLIEWLRATDLHPLVRGALLHLNLIAIHPWFDGNGRTTRIMCLLDLDRIVRARELVAIEPLLEERQDAYFRHIREAVGMSWDPGNHVVTDWVSWYVGLHLEALADGEALNEAMHRDVLTILAALEARSEPADWGALILASAFGPFTVGLVERMYGSSASAARAMAARLVTAGWLIAEGATRGRRYGPSDRVASLGLETPGAARRWARADEQPA